MAPYGVNVNGIAPGYIRTENTAALRAESFPSCSILHRISRRSLGRAKRLIAGAALSRDLSFPTTCAGTILLLDGGWLAR